MSLLRIEIDKIISEENLDNGKVRVIATYSCLGQKERKERIYPKHFWERIKNKGYYFV